MKRLLRRGKSKKGRKIHTRMGWSQAPPLPLTTTHRVWMLLTQESCPLHSTRRNTCRLQIRPDLTCLKSFSLVNFFLGRCTLSGRPCLVWLLWMWDEGGMACKCTHTPVGMLYPAAAERQRNVGVQFSEAFKDIQAATSATSPAAVQFF